MPSQQFQKPEGYHCTVSIILHNTCTLHNDNNDNDKRLELTAKADQPDHKKYSTLKIKIHNEAMQKLHTS